MAEIERRKRATNKQNYTINQTKVEDKLRDEIRTLHEAYQFLSRKYIKLKETLMQEPEEESNNNEKDNKNKKEQRQRTQSVRSTKSTLKSSEDIERFLEEEDEEEDYNYEIEEYGAGDGRSR